ncbi:MAG: TerD family protein, partial [Pseudomonadales bacterium]|nr:TerD family protein [Pseudomonadales bacterium]
TIHEAEARNQNFGQIQNAYIRLYDNDKVVADYDLDEMFSNETAVQFGSFFKLDNEWLFKAVGAGYRLNLGDFVEGYQ